MKIIKNSIRGPSRAAQLGVALSAAIFAASSLQAQNVRPNPSLPFAPPPANSAEVLHPERQFLEFAAQADQTEMAMADVAEARSPTPAVKDLARMMRNDHQQNYAQVQIIAQNHYVVLDGSLDFMNRHTVTRLEKASDADFDKDYTKTVLKDQVKAISLCDHAIAQIDLPDVRTYAESSRTSLRKHLRPSEDAARAVGVDESTIASILRGLPSEEGVQEVSFNQN